jgi:hypothetical protein
MFDLGLQLAPMMLADPATEDHGDLVGLSDRSIGIKQPLPKVVQRRTAMKDQVVAEFDLREEQPMLAARFLSLFRGEEGGEPRQPFLTAGQ